MTSIPSTTDNLLANQLGTNSNQRFSAIVQHVQEDSQNGCFLSVQLREYATEDRTGTPIRTGGIKVGFGFQNGFTVSEDAMGPMTGLALAYLIFDLYFAVGQIDVNIPTTEVDRNFIVGTLDAISSWNRHLSGLVPAKILFQPSVSLAKLAVSALDYNKVVLGASGGKESSLNKIILNKAGYQVEEVTFTKSHHENEPNSSLYLHWIPDEDASWIMMPHLNPLPGTAFDAQGALGVPLYGLLAFVASQKNAGVMAVGTEFGMSKIWYPTDPNSGVQHEVHDFSVDEGLFVCEQLEKFLAGYGLPVHIISPVGPLHELGILRALHDEGFPIDKLDSCWLAKNLQTHYCGQCFKCQRIKMYMDMLEAKLPGRGYGDLLKFENLHIATGSMLSYSVQYNLTEQYPELAWESSLIVDETSLKFLDYRTGNRILKVLVKQMGFKQTILPGLFDQKFEPKVLSSKEFVDRVTAYLGVDYCKLSVENDQVNGNIWFWMPYEEAMLHQIAHTDYANVPEGWVLAPAMSRFHCVPVYLKNEQEWQWFMITEPKEGEEVKYLHLPEHAYAMDIFKLWQGYDTLLAGFTFLNVPYVGLMGEIE